MRRDPERKRGNKASSQRRSQRMAAVKRWMGEKKERKFSLRPRGSSRSQLSPPAGLVTFSEDSSRGGWFQKQKSEWNPVRPYLCKSTCHGCTIVPGRTPKKGHFVNPGPAGGRSTIALCPRGPPTGQWSCNGVAAGPSHCSSLGQEEIIPLSFRS